MKKILIFAVLILIALFFTQKDFANKIDSILLKFQTLVNTTKQDFSSNNDFFGIKLGTVNNYYVVEGPREPPVFKSYLDKYYEIQVDINELKNPRHIGIGVTSNNTEHKDVEGNTYDIHYNQEDIIFGATIWSKEPCLSNGRFYELDKSLQEKYGFTHKDRYVTTKKDNWLRFMYMKPNLLEAAYISCDTTDDDEEINIDYVNFTIARMHMNNKSKKIFDKKLIEFRKSFNEKKAEENKKNRE